MNPAEIRNSLAIDDFEPSIAKNSIRTIESPHKPSPGQDFVHGLAVDVYS